jgi:hypothetical protein
MNGFLFSDNAIIRPGSDRRLTVGRRVDGSFFVDIAGKNNAIAHITPQQAFEIARGLMKALGYELELGNGP